MTRDLIVFDMDGVLVDVSESYRATIQATVAHFTGNEPSRDEIQQWKDRGGFNDDWHLSHRMIHARGGSTTHPEVVDYFQSIFHGPEGFIQRERWIAKDGLFDRLAQSHTLAIFTGRLVWEARITLDRFGSKHFEPIVGADSVSQTKPHPEGLLRIMTSVPHNRVWYIGDTIDDARAAQAAKVPFIGVGHGNLGGIPVITLEDINALEDALAQNQ
ncbi:MAG: HAD family hydrolase [Acidobacteriota bacterium]|nr:HAD family hydrolase [Acidobacteriota bacterium]